MRPTRPQIENGLSDTEVRPSETMRPTSTPDDDLDPHLHAPDGTPGCHFGRGLACLNGARCLNPNHRASADAGPAAELLALAAEDDGPS